MDELDKPLENRIKDLRKARASDSDIVRLLSVAGYEEGEVKSLLRSMEEGKTPEVINLPPPKEHPVTAALPIASVPPVASANTFVANHRLELPSFGAMLQSAYSLYKARFLVLTIVFITPLATLALSAIFMGAARATNMEAVKIFWDFLATLGYVASFVLLTLGVLAEVFALHDEKLGAEGAYWRALKSADKYYWFFLLWVLILLGGAVMGALPLFIFAFWFIFALYIFVDQKQVGMNALLRSKEYVTGYFWDVFWRSVLLFFLALAAEGLVGGFFLPFGAGVSYLASLILQLMVIPFLISFMFTFYSSFKTIKPDLAGEAVKGDRSFFNAAAWLGVLSPLVLFFLLGILNSL